MWWTSSREPSIPSHQKRLCGKRLVSDQPIFTVNRLASPAPFRICGSAGEKPKVSGSQAARSACARLLDDWQAVATAGLTSPEQSVLEAAVARVSADPELLPDALATRIAELAGKHMDGPPRDALTRLLLAVEEQYTQAVAHDDPGAWARQALSRSHELKGNPPSRGDRRL